MNKENTDQFSKLPHELNLPPNTRSIAPISQTTELLKDMEDVLSSHPYGLRETNFFAHFSSKYGDKHGMKSENAFHDLLIQHPNRFWITLSPLSEEVAIFVVLPAKTKDIFSSLDEMFCFIWGEIYAVLEDAGPVISITKIPDVLEAYLGAKIKLAEWTDTLTRFYIYCIRYYEAPSEIVLGVDKDPKDWGDPLILVKVCQGLPQTLEYQRIFLQEGVSKFLK